LNAAFRDPDLILGKSGRLAAGSASGSIGFMSVWIHPKGNPALCCELLDGTPLADFTNDFMHAALRHFDSWMTLHEGDCEFAHDKLKGLSKVTELLDFCLQNWDGFYPEGTFWKVNRLEVAEFNAKLKHVIDWCRTHRVSLLHWAD
jgi:hypothetical protein